jgi:hypothetical protein
MAPCIEWKYWFVEEIAIVVDPSSVMKVVLSISAFTLNKNI